MGDVKCDCSGEATAFKEWVFLTKMTVNDLRDFGKRLFNGERSLETGSLINVDASRRKSCSLLSGVLTFVQTGYSVTTIYSSISSEQVFFFFFKENCKRTAWSQVNSAIKDFRLSSLRASSLGGSRGWGKKRGKEKLVVKLGIFFSPVPHPQSPRLSLLAGSRFSHHLNRITCHQELQQWLNHT